MTKSDLIDKLCTGNPELSAKDVELGGNIILESMSEQLSKPNGRIEIRGFGSFSVHERAPRIGRNPRNGDQVELDTKHVPHFKPGKELREGVDQAVSPAS